MEVSKGRPLQVLDTELYADSCEWCPYEGLQDVLLCGTYQLVEGEEEKTEAGQAQVRVGQLQIYQLTTSNATASPGAKLTKLDAIPMPGILDIKWARQRLDTAAVCGLVNAKGEFQLWKLEENRVDSDKGERTAHALQSSEEKNERKFQGTTDAGIDLEGKLKLEDDDKNRMEEDNGEDGGRRRKGNGKSCKANVSAECLGVAEIGQCIGLSLDWAPPTEGSSARAVTSDSSGGIAVFDVTSAVTLTSQWHAHDFEAWICAFDQWNSELVYSGSDDCKLKLWDLRVGSTPVSTNSRFTMGVCSIQSNPLREHLLAVGSYDENLSIFDTRQMRQPISTTALGGGVWRVKWDPFTGDKILTATMHNGFHIVDCSKPDQEPLPIISHYTGHFSLAYGVDWRRAKTPQKPQHSPAPMTDDNNSEHSSGGNTRLSSEQFCDAELKAGMDLTSVLIASCSFYDHSLQLWEACV